MNTSLAPRGLIHKFNGPRLHAVRSTHIENPEETRRPIAVVLSEAGHRGTTLLPVLAGLGITTLDRAFDANALGIVTAINPDLAVIECDPLSSAGAGWIAALYKESDAKLLVIDSGDSALAAIAALDLGADAVLRADDAAPLVRAMVSALLRGTGPISAPAVAPPPGVLSLAGMTIDSGTFEACESGELIPLTPTEFRILAHLASTPGIVCSATDVMSAIHDYSYTSTEAQQAVKVYIRRIRRKIEACEHPSVEIVNARTFGYRLQATSGDALVVAA